MTGCILTELLAITRCSLPCFFLPCFQMLWHIPSTKVATSNSSLCVSLLLSSAPRMLHRAPIPPRGRSSEQQTRESFLLLFVFILETLNQLQTSAASMFSVSPAQYPGKRIIFPKRIVNLNFKKRQHGGNTVEAQATTLRRITDFVRVLVAA